MNSDLESVLAVLESEKNRTIARQKNFCSLIVEKVTSAFTELESTAYNAVENVRQTADVIRKEAEDRLNAEIAALRENEKQLTSELQGFREEVPKLRNVIQEKDKDIADKKGDIELLTLAALGAQNDAGKVKRVLITQGYDGVEPMDTFIVAKDAEIQRFIASKDAKIAELIKDNDANYRRMSQARAEQSEEIRLLNESIELLNVRIRSLEGYEPQRKDLYREAADAIRERTFQEWDRNKYLGLLGRLDEAAK